MNALDLSKQGYIVSIFEESHFGGAWRPSPQSNNYNYDDGVHILYWQKQLTKERVKYLNKKYNLGLVPIKPLPKGQRFAFGYNFPELSFARSINCSQFYKSIKSILSREITRQKNYYYFKGGCFKLQKRLLQLCKESSIEINLNRSVKFIEDRNDKIHLITEEKSYEYDYVLASSRVLNANIIKSSKFSFSPNDKEKINKSHKEILNHIFLEVINPGEINFSFFKFRGDHPIFAVSDVRFYSSIEFSNRNEKSTVFHFAMNKNTFDKTSDYLLSELIRNNLCSRSAKVLNTNKTTDKSINIDPDIIKKINLSLNKTLFVYRYDNLSKELVKHIKNPLWENLFKN